MADMHSDLGPEQELQNRAHIASWVSRELGGTVVAMERQNRWRPAWYLTVDVGGERKELYVRGSRDFFLPWPLEHEAAVLTVLHRNGIPVPRVYGMCSEPRAIVMDAIDGSRDMSDLSEAQRVAIMDEYVDILRRIHAIDIEEFRAVGVDIPKNPEESALVFFGPTEKGFAENRIAPDAFVAFVRTWVRRHLPLHRTRLSFVTGDPGQFLVKDGKIASLIDFEISYVGDPLADLGGLRIRNLEEPFGDDEYVIRRYAELEGEALDSDSINFYTVVLAAVTNLMIHRNLLEPKADMAIWRAWEVKASRLTLTAIADVHGLEFAAITPPEPSHRQHDVAYESLRLALSALPAPAPLDEYNRTNALHLAQHLQDVNAIGLSMDEDDLRDAENLLGRKLTDYEESELHLEEFVSDYDQDREIDIINFFDRRFQRRRLVTVSQDERLWLYDIPNISKIFD